MLFFLKYNYERKKYEKNRSRRQHGRWVFQDMDYICCSSYGRPRSTTYIYTHYKKHGRDTKCKSAEEYLIKANNVIENRNAIHKQTVDDDTAYYIVPTGEFVVVSPAKYIRTYYRTDYKYYLKQ